MRIKNQPQTWQFIGAVPPGGDVLQMSGSQEAGDWVVSPAGLFQRLPGVGRAERENSWRAVVQGVPFANLTAIHVAGKSVWAAGIPAGIIRSLNCGKTWHPCWTDRVQTPISALVASPNYQHDRVLLAGTHGEGILRSTDGGRYWKLSNFGLRSFNVFALAVQPEWDRREKLYAATEHGVYYSPNGGRAWQARGLESQVVISLAVISSSDQVTHLVAGTEGGNVFYSPDGGVTWSAAHGPGPESGSVNALLVLSRGEILAGTSEGGVWQSQDGGNYWKPLGALPANVFHLATRQGIVFAATIGRGLFRLDSSSAAWQLEPDLSARRFERLDRLPSGALVAQGEHAGLWVSPDNGRHWQVLQGEAAIGESQQAFSVHHGLGWAVIDGSLVVLDDIGGSRVVSSDFNQVQAIVSTPHGLWAGGENGAVWRSENGLEAWQRIETPFTGIDLIKLGRLMGKEGMPVLAAAVFRAHSETMQLWYTNEEHVDWQLWYETKSPFFACYLPVNGALAESPVFALDRDILVWQDGRWTTQSIGRQEAPTSALAWHPALRVWLAATTDEVFLSAEGERWEALSSGLDGEPVIALLPDHESGNVWALTVDGKLFLADLTER